MTSERIDAYYEANMDLRDARPHLNLYNQRWPLRTAYYNQPPAKFVFDEYGRRGEALHWVYFRGLYRIGRSSAQFGTGPLGVRALVEPGRGLVLMDSQRYRPPRPRAARDIDKNVFIARGATRLVTDLDRDRQRFHVTDSGLVLIAKAPKRERLSL